MVQLNEQDLVEAQELQFPDREVVKFLITDFRENPSNGNIILKVQALTSEHKGQDTEIFITTKDNPASKKRRAQFFNEFIAKGVWTKADLLAGTAELKKLLGRVLTAKSELRESNGKKYQNWGDLQDEGLQPQGAAVAGAPGAAAAANVTY